MHKCKCQDTNSHVCGDEMTDEQFEQDGMCSFCADFVWAEMRAEGEFLWSNKEKDKQ